MKLHTWYEQKRKAFIERLDEETQQRQLNDEVHKFNKKFIIIPLFVILLGSIFYLRSILNEQVDYYGIIYNQPEVFYPVEKSNLFFNKAKTPKELQAQKITKYEIDYKPWDQARFQDFDVENIWYEFQFEVPEKIFEEKQTGMHLPLLFGKYEVYLNNKLVSFGNKSNPIIYLDQRKNHLLLRMNSKDSARYGIRSMIPAFVGNVEKVRSYIKMIYTKSAHTKVIITKLVTLFIFLMLFVLMPNKPEILAFSLFFLTNLLYILFYKDLQSSEPILPISRNSAQWLISGTLFLRSFSMVWFVLEFFRYSKKRISIILLRYFFISSVVYLASYSVLSRSNPFEFSLMYAQGLMDICTACFVLYFALRKLYYLSEKFDVNLRVVISAVFLGTVLYYLYTNIQNQLAYTNSVTPFSNYLYIYFTFTVVTLIEISRSEKEKIKWLKAFPNEVREKLQKRSQLTETPHYGAILLVDMVNFSQYQNSVPLEKQASFMKSVLGELLKSFHHASVLSCTGDGFYLAWRENFKEIRLYELLAEIYQFQNHISEKKVLIEGVPLKNIKFRFSLGYGHYITTLLEEEHQITPLASGALLSDLSRIIGSGDNEFRVRVLMNEELHSKEFVLKYKKPSHELSDKHGKAFQYIQLDSCDLKELTESQKVA